MDFGIVAEKENVSTPTEHMQHLANENLSMKGCSLLLAHGTSTLQMKSELREENGS